MTRLGAVAAVLLVVACAKGGDPVLAGCEGGEAQACAHAAKAAEGKRNNAEAARLYEKACTGGVAAACTTLAYGIFDRDKAGAAKHLGRACELGDGPACTRLGSMHWAGQGVPTDSTRAYSLSMQGCEKGDPRGCFAVAACHKSGQCAEKDEAKATAFMKRACDGGDKTACLNLPK